MLTDTKSTAPTTDDAAAPKEGQRTIKLSGVITPQFWHLLGEIMLDISRSKPFEDAQEARQELAAILNDEYTVMQRGGTYLLVK